MEQRTTFSQGKLIPFPYILPSLRTHAVVEWNGVDDVEVAKVVLVRSVIAVPGDDIEGRVVLECQLAFIALD